MSDVASEVAALSMYDDAASALALDGARAQHKLLTSTVSSLERNRDVLESEVAQFLFGCVECGYIAEAQRPDICPACGSIAGEFELFAPFFAGTQERIARRQPDEIVAMLRADPSAYAAALDGVPEDVLRRRPAPGEWCISEVAGHIVDIAELFCRRMRASLEPEAPQQAERTPLPWKLLEGQGYDHMSAPTLIARFDAAARGALSLIERLDAAGWRQRVDLVTGRTAAIDAGSWLVNHNRAHLEQIRALRERYA
jgi:hypothetical protein